MKPKEITLNLKKSDLEELYFKNGKEKLLFSKPVKEQFILTLIAGLFVAASLTLSIITHKSWGIFTIITLLFILIMNDLFKKMAPIKKWKRSIKDLINEQTKYISQKLILSEDSLTLKQDTTITVIRWNAFKKVVMDTYSINLFGDEQLIFPKKSMNSAEFDFLRDEILLRIKS